MVDKVDGEAIERFFANLGADFRVTRNPPGIWTVLCPHCSVSELAIWRQPDASRSRSAFSGTYRERFILHGSSSAPSQTSPVRYLAKSTRMGMKYTFAWSDRITRSADLAKSRFQSRVERKSDGKTILFVVSQ
jgi:hypothetical protein